MKALYKGLKFYSLFLLGLTISESPLLAQSQNNDSAKSKVRVSEVEANSNLLCIDSAISSISIAVKLVRVQPLCEKYNIISTSGKTIISSVDDVIAATAESPNIKSADFAFYASKLNTKAYYIKAFAPTVSISGGRTYSFSGTQQSTNFSYNDGVPTTSTQEYTSYQPSWTSSLSPSIKLPLFFPQDISLAKYYGSIEISTAYSSTDSDLQQYSSSLVSFVDLWIANKQLSISQQNIDSAIKSLDVTVNQYRLGLLAVPDVAQSLTNLRNYQTNYTNAIMTYNSALYNLVSAMGTTLERVRFSTELFNPSTLEELRSLGTVDYSKLSYEAVVNSAEIYSILYQAEAANNQSRYYLSQYLPSIALVFGWSPSNEYTQYKAVSGSQIIQQYSQNQLAWGNSISLGFTWNIFDSFSNATLASAQRKESKKYIEQAKNLAVQKVSLAQSSFTQVNSFNIQLNQINEAINAAQISYDSTIIAVKAGFSNVTTMTQRLDQLTSAKSSYWNAFRSLLTAKINLGYLTRSGLFYKINPYNLKFNIGIVDKHKIRP